jgi:hypothetical protein
LYRVWGRVVDKSIGNVGGSNVYRLRDEALDWLDVEGEVIALDSEESKYLRVNESGAGLWRLLTRGTTQDEMVDLLVSEYEIDEGRAAADVDSFLAMIRGQGLLAEDQ